ncbi:GMP synthase (glutamine-hydrolysing) [Sphingomonas jejuensis]|uniref:GMP synthase (Glutamine-hydrolysing) n=1 Tax=Sphingomonas jejuensis TaxID=904715 RepID=A0ABX0XM68_9SPHN|nr:glutamine amidotransferase [Sphingomonas jejuensis]NJC33909.1 GMP synthase (glutamine-hydrolysing) [Sphingomonas jejuensis]
MKRALVIRHVPREGVAGFRKPLEDAGYRLDQIDVGDERFADVDLNAPDLLVMMGGPMGVYETDAHPWIRCQLRRLRRRLEARLPTLGACLGAQMIAAALGERVFAGPRKEVGFAPVTLAPTAGGNPLAALDGVPVLHWHGDSFDLPAGAERLASTAVYQNQAFRLGPTILALQFHAEMGLDPVFHDWVEAWPTVVEEGGTTAEALTTAHGRHGQAAVAAGRAMIAGWLAGLALEQRAAA